MSDERATVAFGAMSATEIVPACYARIRRYYEAVRSRGLLSLWRKSDAMSQGASLESGGFSWKIVTDGEQGEIKRSVENHYRAIGDHKIQITTQTRPAIQCCAANSDKQSLEQTAVGDAVVEYHLTERALERLIKQSAKKAVYQGEGFIEGGWDAHAGDDVAPETEGLLGAIDNPEAAAPKMVKSGEPEFHCLGPLDVIRDPCAKSWTEAARQWVITRKWVNKYDLAAKYPDLAPKIVNLAFNSASDDCVRLDPARTGLEETDLIPLWTLHHMKTPAVPDGRIVVFASEDVTLIDGPYPYRTLMLAREAPDELGESPFGATPMTDLLGPQDAFNAADTSILTNQTLRGTGNVKCNDPNVDITAFAGFGNVVQIKDNGVLEPLEFPATPSEFFQYKADKKEAMAALVGSNSVAMGSPSAELSGDAPGNKMALFVETAMRNNSGFEQSHVDAIRDTAQMVLHLYADFGGSHERLAKILGKSRAYLVKSFTADTLKDIDRVRVDLGNPALRTTQGKMSIADRMVELELINSDTAPQYLELIKTGSLDPLTENIEAEENFVRGENEALMDGSVPHVPFLYDNHIKHIRSHKALLNNPQLRQNTPENAAAQERITAALQVHRNMLLQMPPEAIAMLSASDRAVYNEILALMAPPMPPNGTTPPAPGASTGTPPPPAGDASSTMGPPQGGETPGLPSLPKSPLTGAPTDLGAAPPGALQ